MQTWGIYSPRTAVAAIGTAAKESASTFAPVEEAFWLSNAGREAFYADTSKHAAYHGGTKFHGRGYVQTTHDYNYQKVEDALAARGIMVDLIAHPELLLQAEYAAPALVVYFVDRGIPAMAERQAWDQVRRAVFGGYDADGIARIQRCADYLLPRIRQ